MDGTSSYNPTLEMPYLHSSPSLHGMVFEHKDNFIFILQLRKLHVSHMQFLYPVTFGIILLAQHLNIQHSLQLQKF
jgi:hypothetical protein